MPELEVVQSHDLPNDWQEIADAGPDGASLDGTSATYGLPLQSSARPDVEAGLTESDRRAVIAAAEHITRMAAAVPVMHASQACLNLIAGFEGFSPVIYHDSVGVPTIGYGTTSAVVYPLPTHVTRAEALVLLARDLSEHVEPAIRAMGVPLNQHQFDACCSIGYNVGPGIFGTGWTLGRDLRARDYAAAAQAFLLYDEAGGQVLAGLRTRRAEERALFLEPMPAAPDPHHLLWFPDRTWLIGGKRVPERATVAEWWKLVGDKQKNRRELLVLQSDAVLLRKRVWTVAHQGGRTNWAPDHRGGRWQELNAIANAHL